MAATEGPGSSRRTRKAEDDGRPTRPSRTAAQVLEAAKRIVAERGIAALTLDAVAEESGTYRSAIRYHYGDKAGLIAAVMDSTALTPDTTPLFATTMGVEQGPERIAAHLTALKTVSADREQYRLFWSLLPHILSESDLRQKLDGLYDGYRQINSEALGGGARTPDDERRLLGLATLLTAVCDGLGLLACLGGDEEGRPGPAGPGRDAAVAAAYEVLGEMLEAIVPGLTAAEASKACEKEGPA